MITLFNREELMITLDMNKQSNIRRILSDNNIQYVIKTTNLQNSQVVGSHRGRIGNLGINQDYSYEYKIFVHKNDYEKALKIIRDSNV